MFGTSKFFVSLEDQLIKRFASYEQFQEAYADKKGNEISSKTLRLQFNYAQKKIEGFNYDSRKSVLNYDDVIRQQRDLIYAQRDLILTSSNVDFIIKRMFASAAKSVVQNDEFNTHHNYDYDALVRFLNENIGQLVSFNFDISDIVKVHENDLPNYIANIILSLYEAWIKNATENADPEEIAQLQKQSILSVLDSRWQRQINRMDKLRSNVNLVQYSQKNPYQVYTEEGTKLFEAMLNDIAYKVMVNILKHRMGKKSLITKAMRQDPLFQTMIQVFNFSGAQTIEEFEQSMINKYYELKQQEINSKQPQN